MVETLLVVAVLLASLVMNVLMAAIVLRLEGDLFTVTQRLLGLTPRAQQVRREDGSEAPTDGCAAGALRAAAAARRQHRVQPEPAVGIIREMGTSGGHISREPERTND